MSKWTRLKREFLNNGDTDIVIAFGIFVGGIAFILSLMTQISITLVSSLTLSLLGVLAVSIRRDRQSDLNKKDQSLKAFEQQREAYRHLISAINQYGAREAVLLQYSSTTSSDVLHVLLNQGARVTVFIQHEDTAANIGSQLQADRIKTAIRSIQDYLRRNPSRSDKLKIYKFRTPATLSAIKIDNRILCMGWYTYEQVDPAAHKHYGSDTVAVSGHDVATLVAWGGTEEFEVLDKTFSMLENNYRNNSEEMLL